MLTDITYLFYGKGKKAYLSSIKDSTPREVLVYYVSSSLQIDIVYSILDYLKERLGEVTNPETFLYSDQGIQYIHLESQKRIRDMRVRQSMPHRGNYLNNAMMEPFLGHMKDEGEYKDYQAFESMELTKKDYMEKYNYTRYQCTLKKMASVEYRNHLVSA
ncbi:IS3 family transposase [Bacillus cereus]|uniref:IS3 family transposase n=1 Tax=Bacillus cereus TaxID=1396 RepID=UPI0025A07D6B|nr:IS3 family transposase [Bacillus cereus]MDM5236853.1 IS3 family transposase [Bacillus cereus]